MVEVYSILGILVGIFFVSTSLIKLKKQSIGQNTFVIWFVLGLIIIIGTTVVQFSLSVLQSFLGTDSFLSATFGIVIIFLLILVFYLHQRVDLLNHKLIKLISELAVKQYDSSIDEKRYDKG